MVIPVPSKTSGFRFSGDETALPAPSRYMKIGHQRAIAHISFAHSTLYSRKGGPVYHLYSKTVLVIGCRWRLHAHTCAPSPLDVTVTVSQSEAGSQPNFQSTIMSHTMSPSYGGSCGTFDDTEVGLADVSKEWSGIKKRMYKTQVCKYYIRGRCLHGPLCAFAHSVDELNMKPDLTKTKLCIKPGCSNPKCSFAHTLDELRLAVGTKDTFIDAYDANITPSNAVGQTSDPYSAYFENQYRILSSGRGSTNLGLLPNPPTSSALPPPRKGGVQGPIEGRRRNSAPVVQDDSTSSKFEGGFSTPSTTSGSTNDDIQDLLQCLRLFSSMQYNNAVVDKPAA